MERGLIAEYDEYRIYGTPTVTYSDTGDDSYPLDARGDVYSRYTPNVTDVLAGIWTTFSSSLVAGVSNYQWRLRIPALGYDSDAEGENVTGAATGSGVKSEVVIYDFKLYTDLSGIDPFWTLEWSDIKWFVGGVEQSMTGVGGAGSLTSAIYTPAGIPLIGIPATLAAGAGSNNLYTNWNTLTTVNEYNASASCTMLGGWKFVHDSEDIAFPVDFQRADMPLPGSACKTSPPTASIGATTTDSASITGTFSVFNTVLDYGELSCSECPPGSTLVTPGVYEPTGVQITEQVCEAEVCLMPAVPRSFERLNDDFGAIVYRGAFPAADAVTRRECVSIERVDFCEETNEEIRQVVTDSDRYFNPASDFLGIMRNAPSAMEDVLGTTAKCPYEETARRVAIKTFFRNAITSGECTTGGHLVVAPECCYDNEHYRWEAELLGTFAFDNGGHSSISFPIGGQFQQLNHSKEIAKYVNYCCSPHWSFLLYFPHEDAILSSQWNIENSDTYWLPLRTQYLFHPDIGSKADRTRNHIVSEPLSFGQLAAHIADAYVAEVPTSWVGISRFDVKTFSFSPFGNTLGTASEPSWTFTNCTAAFAAGGITLTPTGGATNLTADYKLGQFDHVPYFLPQHSSLITVNWQDANVSAVTVKLVNQDGDEITLGTTKTTYTVPRNQEDDKFVGSWAQDWGLGAVTDTGADIGAAGVSAATLADTIRTHAYQLFGGFTAEYLRFEITVTSSASTCELEYPTFVVAANKEPIQETGQFASVLDTGQVHTRFGQWNFYDSGSELLVDTPTLRVPGELSTEPDVRAWGDLLRGVAPFTTTTDFDSTEYTTDTDLVTGTHGFLPPRHVPANTASTIFPAVLVNSLRECPPIPVLPRKKRKLEYDTDIYEETGEYGLYAYTFCQNRNKYLSAKQPIRVVELSSGNDICNAQEQVSTDWWVSSHIHPVYNDETTSDFEIRIGDTAYGEVTPWHGYSAVLADNPAGSGLAITRDELNIHHIAFVEGTKIKVQSTNWESYDQVSEVIDDGDAGNPSIAWHPNGVCIVAFDNGTNVYASLNYARGINGYWTTGALSALAAGTNPCIAVDPNIGTIFYAYHNGTKFVIDVYDNLTDFVGDDPTSGSPYDIVTVNAGQAGLEVGVSDGRWLAFVYTDNSGDRQRLMSYNNGATWG